MRWKWVDAAMAMIIKAVFLLTLLTINFSEGNRQTAQRRKDTARFDLHLPEPSAMSIQALAQAVGAAGFESYTEGKPLVKRLTPADSQPDLDLIEHQGVIGKPGIDFPAFPNIPNTGFNCKNVPTGYYADLETDCQVFHICDTSRKISFLCPNGTIFSQSHLICDWWFKVDCASAPALYESSAEYYSNQQKKSQKVTQSLSKTADLQQIGTDTNIRSEPRRAPANFPSTTERFLRHRQRLQNDQQQSKATSRSYKTLVVDPTFNPTQRPQTTTAFEKRRKNLVQLIANNFGNSPSRTTLPSYSEVSTYRTPTAAGDFNSIREMQVAAESASFANNNNRQYLQDYNKNYRPYPVYTPNLTARQSKTKSGSGLTTLYDIRDKQPNNAAIESTTKRLTLLPYTKKYTAHDKHEPYTRPGVSLLKAYIEKEKNKTSSENTEKFTEVTERSDLFQSTKHIENKVSIDTKDSFESVTRIPQVTRSGKSYFDETASSDRYDVYSATNIDQSTTAPSYQERRERLMRKLNLGTYGVTPLTPPSTEKFYGDLPNRPGLVVPSSLTPKTLHTLAIYYATALDNLSTTPPQEETEATTTAFDEYEALDDGVPALFSRQTLDKYSSLFSQEADNADVLEDINFEANRTYNNKLTDDLAVQQSQNPIATSPQIRELAQVFTHALSAYLQDPVQFRKVLSDIRPTHPSFTDMLATTEDSFNTEPTTTVNEDDEILGFSDDNKSRSVLASLRDRKALNLAIDYSTITNEAITTPRAINTEAATTPQPTTPRSIFRCCARISASYTSASTPQDSATTPSSSTNTGNTFVNNYSDYFVTTTENSYLPKYGGFQNNTVEESPYGKDVKPADGKPLSEYVETTNLPSAWGLDSTPLTNSHANIFDIKKIRPTTALKPTTPVYFTETDSVELENDEKLQRAYSQSFVAPQNNNVRQGKQFYNFEEYKTTVKIPSGDLEAPTLADIDSSTLPTTTQRALRTEDIAQETLTTTSGNIFTSSDSDSTTYQFQWPNSYENWQSTALDPITLNDNLSPTGPEHVVRQTNTWSPNTATTPVTYRATNEPSVSSTYNVEYTTPDSNAERVARLLAEPISTEAAQLDLTTITDTVVEKAKEIMGSMNATTTEKLMNVMKKTKSKTVRRLILLLVQTCDDDHNSTAEASKKALLEALMAVSQNDMDEIAREEGATKLPTTNAPINVTQPTEPPQRKAGRLVEGQEIRSRNYDRRGKSLNFDPSAINSLSNPTTTAYKPSEVPTTTQSPTTTTEINRRGTRKFLVKTTSEPSATSAPFVENPRAAALVNPQRSDLKASADTRALELLRSLYTIAARWG